MRRPRRADTPAAEQAEPAPVAQAEPRHLRPKILVIDAAHIASVLRECGYAADTGTFGSVQSAPASGGYWPVKSDASLPGHTEKEIVVVDLAARPEVRETDASTGPQPGVERIWAPVIRDRINARPLAALCEQAVMDRVHRHGGVFIVFTSGRLDVRYVLGTTSQFQDLQPRSETIASNWDLLGESVPCRLPRMPARKCTRRTTGSRGSCGSTDISPTATSSVWSSRWGRSRAAGSRSR
jgi:hypothetical protein